MVVSKTDVVIVGVLGVAALAATGYLANVLPKLGSKALGKAKETQRDFIGGITGRDLRTIFKPEGADALYKKNLKEFDRAAHDAKQRLRPGFLVGAVPTQHPKQTIDTWSIDPEGSDIYNLGRSAVAPINKLFTNPIKKDIKNLKSWRRGLSWDPRTW